MKSTVTENLEADALRAVRDLLDQVPHLEGSSVRPKQQPGKGHPIDGWIDLKQGTHTYTLVIEVKRNGAPRFIRPAVYQLKGYLEHVRPPASGTSDEHMIPMLAAPYLSPDSRSICLEHDVAYLDLLGNAHLVFDNVYIDRSVADRPKSETRALRSIFAPKAAAILRVLLRDPAKAWRVTELADTANASLGHVSNVRKALLAREWIEKRRDGIVLAQPAALMRTWREEYHTPVGVRSPSYTIYHGEQLNERLIGVLNSRPSHPRAVYSLHSAAQWSAPFVRSGTHNFYADAPGALRLKEVLQLTPVRKGANVVVCTPKDENLLADAVEPAPGIFCTNPIVTYLDLWNGSDRDREAAEQLASKSFPWR